MALFGSFGERIMQLVRGAVPPAYGKTGAELVRLIDKDGNDIDMGGGSAIVLPVPKVSLSTVNSANTFKYYDNGLNSANATLINPPVLIVKDIVASVFANQVFIEMVHLVMRRKDKNRPNRPSGMQWVAHVAFAAKPWTATRFWNRNGNDDTHVIPQYDHIHKSNQLAVTGNGQLINLVSCLDGLMKEKDMDYRDVSAANSSATTNITLIAPVPKRGIMSATSRFYAIPGGLKPLYVAFRYIVWLPTENGGRGQIISGPLSQTIRVGYSHHPLVFDPFTSQTKGFQVAFQNPKYVAAEFKCRFAR